MNKLTLYYDELEKVLPTATTYIEPTFKFTGDNLAIEVKIGEDIQDLSYYEGITLVIRVVGIIEQQFDIINKTFEIDKLVNNFKFSNLDRIVRENVYYSNYIDKEKFNTVLMYKIRNYK
ncbi:hypothetical protein QYB58_000743 [Clostridium perfringens]|nr:hypothetical protein [Clostridium perfringens]MDU5883016.1 hypothetical protein [Clostridium perfringens]